MPVGLAARHRREQIAGGRLAGQDQEWPKPRVVDRGTRRLQSLRDAGCILLVSTHNLGSVPEFCDQVVLINRTVLAAGPTEEVFTEANLARAFGGVLRHFRFDESTVQKHDGKAVTLLTDDERPLVFGKDGHLEYSRRAGHEQVVEQRAEAEDDQ